MNTKLIAHLIRDRMAGGMSEREVARQAKVGNSTINRLLNGQPISLTTLQKVAEWLEVKPADLVPGDNVSEAIASLIAKEPTLGAVLAEAVEKMDDGDISPEVLREVVRYAVWRLENALEADKQRGFAGNADLPDPVPED